MSQTTPRYSPVHHLLDARQPEWTDETGMPIALRFEDDDVERTAMIDLGLCDLSGLAKVGLKGPQAEQWLHEHDVEVPGEVYDSCRLADGGVIVRLGTTEFLLENGFSKPSLPTIETAAGQSPAGLFRVERQDATFLLVGGRAADVLSQTCGINFQEAEIGRLIMSRVAGVSAGILPEVVAETAACRIWIDPTYAEYLWNVLEEICGDLGGRVIGAGCLMPSTGRTSTLR